jgi:hypothetical protein
MNRFACWSSPRCGAVLILALFVVTPLPGRSETPVAVPPVSSVTVPAIEASAPAEPPIQGTMVVPEVLLPWIPWVLESGPEAQDQRACPIDPETGTRFCAWPGRLALDLHGDGGSFSQSWRVWAESWIPLPGDIETWPLDTQVGGRPVPVILHEGRPSARLGVGEHRLTGRFAWTRAPDALEVPPIVG